MICKVADVMEGAIWYRYAGEYFGANLVKGEFYRVRAARGLPELPWTAEVTVEPLQNDTANFLEARRRGERLPPEVSWVDPGPWVWVEGGEVSA
ncbi:MAG TPA: hypothetical protein VEI97_11270, partial [bacterium]|nr:hypothetical protein [bacterium]